MNDIRKFDILGLIDDELTDAAAEQRMRFENKEKKRMNLKVAALLAATLALISAMVFALPALIKDEPSIPVEYSYLEDLPAVETVGMASWVGYLRFSVFGGEERALEEEEILKFFALSDISDLTEQIGVLDRISGTVGYEPWGEVHQVSFLFVFADGGYISMIIDPKKVYDSHINGTAPILKIGRYTVSKTVYYRGYDAETGEPIRDDGSIILHMQKSGAGLRVLADDMQRDSAALEIVYNFLLNADYDFRSLETKEPEQRLTYFYLGNEIPNRLIDSECVETSEYIREPAGNYKVKTIEKEKLDKFFTNTNEYIRKLFDSQIKRYSAEAVYDSSGKLHSVCVKFYFGRLGKEEYITAVFDPKAILDFSDKATVELGEYTVAFNPYGEIIELGDRVKSFEPSSALGYMQSDDAAILMRAEGYNYYMCEILINFIVYSDLDFKALEN